MTLEESISALLDRKLSPLVEANRKLADTVEALRRALPTDLATPAEAARELGVSTKTVRRRLKDGSLPSRRVGKSVRVDMTAVRHGPSAEDLAKFTGPSPL